MLITDFTHNHIAAARSLAKLNYDQEREIVPALPPIDVLPDLTRFADYGLGVAAFDGDKLVGFLCSGSPRNNAFGSTDVKGVFSPLGANAATLDNRAKIYAAMYQAAGDKWALAGAASHAICLYAHGIEAQQQFFLYGFGLRCVDAIRSMEAIDCRTCNDYSFAELTQSEFASVFPLDQMLNEHMRQSPTFMLRKADTQEEFLRTCREEQVRCFVAIQSKQICAFLKIADMGETFITPRRDTKHINGAFCLPEHRGKGVYQNLLNFTISTLAAEGYTRLGVDFESFNPTAYGFWLKYFKAYTHSVVRRIDERVILAPAL